MDDFKMKNATKRRALALVVDRIAETRCAPLVERRAALLARAIEGAATVLEGAGRRYGRCEAFLAERLAVKTRKLSLGVEAAALIGRVELDGRRPWPGLVEALNGGSPFAQNGLVMAIDSDVVELPCEVVSFVSPNDHPLTRLPQATLASAMNLDTAPDGPNAHTAQEDVIEAVAEAHLINMEITRQFAPIGRIARAFSGFTYASELIKEFEPARALFDRSEAERPDEASRALLLELS